MVIVHKVVLRLEVLISLPSSINLRPFGKTHLHRTLMVVSSWDFHNMAPKEEKRRHRSFGSFHQVLKKDARLGLWYLHGIYQIKKKTQTPNKLPVAHTTLPSTATTLHLFQNYAFTVRSQEPRSPCRNGLPLIKTTYIPVLGNYLPRGYRSSRTGKTLGYSYPAGASKLNH